MVHLNVHKIGGSLKTPFKNTSSLFYYLKNYTDFSSPNIHNVRGVLNPDCVLELQRDNNHNNVTTIATIASLGIPHIKSEYLSTGTGNYSFISDSIIANISSLRSKS